MRGTGLDPDRSGFNPGAIHLLWINDSFEL